MMTENLGNVQRVNKAINKWFAKYCPQKPEFLEKSRKVLQQLHEYGWNFAAVLFNKTGEEC